MTTIKPGQIYRDTYFDGKRSECTKRTIRIVEIDGDKVRAECITNVRGEILAKPRNTRLSFKTIASGYELQEGGQ